MARAHSTLVMLLILLLLLLLNNNGSSHEECKASSCGHNQPPIKFPFQLVKESSQDQCVYPKEFCLYCTENKKTMISLPSMSGPVQFFVSEIDYESQSISISDPNNCLPQMLPKLNTSSFQFYKFDTKLATPVLLFNCSSVRKRHLRNEYQTSPKSQDMITCPIYAVNLYDSVLTLDLLLCTKMYQFQFNASISVSNLMLNRLSVRWSKPNCTVCETKGMKCRWNNNGTKGGTDCFHDNNKQKKNQIKKYIVIATTGK